ncbi:hypothetical protein GW17_00062501 [Ensete ventricosum]|nr:hypothetical protein GW17_00062501 [Ensete ventricosum]
MHCVVGRLDSSSVASSDSRASSDGARMAVEGAVGLDMASRGATLVLRASWFNRSFLIRVKEIAVVREYGYRAFTSPLIFSFRPSIKVLKSCFLDQSTV